MRQTHHRTTNHDSRGSGFRNAGRHTSSSPKWRDVSEDDLPAPGTTRWTANRKAIVVAAIETGVLSREEAWRRYSLSDQELESWRRRFARFGLAGLQVTHCQDHREPQKGLSRLH